MQHVELNSRNYSFTSSTRRTCLETNQEHQQSVWSKTQRALHIPWQFMFYRAQATATEGVLYLPACQHSTGLCGASCGCTHKWSFRKRMVEKK